jgi:hypothetical protein
VKGFAQWLTSRPYRVALLAAALALLPPLGIVGAGLLVLLSLQRGAAAGWGAAAIAAALLVGIGLAQGADAVGALTAVLLFWGPALLLAEVLRRAGRLGPPMEAAAFGGIAIVLLWFALTGGAPTQLLDEFVAQMEPLLAGSVDPAQTRALLALTLPGLLALSLVLGAVVSLLLGMAWHASLVSPGSLGQAFRELRMSRTLGTIGLAVLAAAVVMGSSLWVSLAIAMSGVFVIQGLGMMHGLAKIRGWPGGVIIAMYVLLLFAMSLMAPMLATVGLADTWMDFRGRAARAAG